MCGQVQAVADGEGAVQVEVLAAGAVDLAENVAEAAAVLEVEHLEPDVEVGLDGGCVGGQAGAGGAGVARVVADVFVADHAGVVAPGRGRGAAEAAVEVDLHAALGGAVEVLEPADVGGKAACVEAAFVREVDAALQRGPEAGLAQAAHAVVADGADVPGQRGLGFGRGGRLRPGRGGGKGRNSGMQRAWPCAAAFAVFAAFIGRRFSMGVFRHARPMGVS